VTYPLPFPRSANRSFLLIGARETRVLRLTLGLEASVEVEEVEQAEVGRVMLVDLIDLCSFRTGARGCRDEAITFTLTTGVVLGRGARETRAVDRPMVAAAAVGTTDARLFLLFAKVADETVEADEDEDEEEAEDPRVCLLFASMAGVTVEVALVTFFSTGIVATLFSAETTIAAASAWVLTASACMEARTNSTSTSNDGVNV
jgi:hypothetical protein